MSGIEDYYVYGLDNRPLDHDLVECPKCHTKQYEKPAKAGDKYAWQCRACGAPVENGKLHLLGQTHVEWGIPGVLPMWHIIRRS